MISKKTEANSREEILNVLNPTVKTWFFSKFKDFSQTQLYGVMEIHSRSNTLISAPTGATKTLTAFLSILNELVDSSQKEILEDRIYAVYVSPLRALNQDIQHNLREPLAEISEKNGKELGIRVMTRTGDTTPYERAKMAKTPPHILITTPESLAILLQTRSFREHLRGVSWCIVDEIHALAENKRGTHLSLTMEMLERLSPGICRIGLSATIAPLEEIAHFLVGADRQCRVIDVQFLKQLDMKVISPVPDLINTTYEGMQKKTYALMDNLIQEHKTTLVFTNTRSATERVVHHLKSRFPENYTDVLDIEDEADYNIGEEKKITGIGAHHGSLSRNHRYKIEQGLRDGKLKAVVCSTSLELGIDIGYIDLVILLGSPKSVARALQRVGRAGHQLHATTKGRIVVLDRDDLVECSVLLKSAMEKKIDSIHIPTNALDVLAQQIYGICIAEKIHIKELSEMVRKSYPYKDLSSEDFHEVINYLSGEYAALEDRHVYAKI
ncbi:MAG: DEAD/DEAH box helicase, partial [Candidatus Nanoarchaeia archaeon]